MLARASGPGPKPTWCFCRMRRGTVNLVLIECNCVRFPSGLCRRMENEVRYAHSRLASVASHTARAVCGSRLSPQLPIHLAFIHLAFSFSSFAQCSPRGGLNAFGVVGDARGEKWAAHRNGQGASLTEKLAGSAMDNGQSKPDRQRPDRMRFPAPPRPPARPAHPTSRRLRLRGRPRSATRRSNRRPRRRMRSAAGPLGGSAASLHSCAVVDRDRESEPSRQETERPCQASPDDSQPLNHWHGGRRRAGPRAGAPTTAGTGVPKPGGPCTVTASRGPAPSSLPPALPWLPLWPLLTGAEPPRGDAACAVLNLRD